MEIKAKMKKFLAEMLAWIIASPVEAAVLAVAGGLLGYVLKGMI